MRLWIVLTIAVFSAGCLTQTVATPVPSEVPAEESVTTPFSIPACEPAPGVNLKLQKTGDYLAELIASGLQPGETPYVYYNSVGEITKGGGFPGDKVGEDGEFYSDLNWRFWDVDILEPPEGQTSVTWDIRLAHSRGVECATITLP